MRPVRWVGARSLRVRLGCFTNLHRQSSRNPVPRIMWTLELQRWPHTSDACGLRPDGCVMAARLHVCSLGTLELESARADLDNHLLMGLDRAWHSFITRFATMDARRAAGRLTFPGARLRTLTSPPTRAPCDPSEVTTCVPSDAYVLGVTRRRSGVCSAFTSLSFPCFDQIVKLAVHA